MDPMRSMKPGIVSPEFLIQGILSWFLCQDFLFLPLFFQDPTRISVSLWRIAPGLSWFC